MNSCCSLYSHRIIFLFVLVLTSSPFSHASRALLEKPYLTTDLQDKLTDLPYGLSERKALFLRYRHINSVQFFGGATNCRFSFKRGQSLMDKGLSLRLSQQDKQPWANVMIQLKKPIDVRAYNSLVVWVWPSQSNMRLWFGLQGGEMARCDALPTQGFPPHEPSQLVIPFERFSPKTKVNWNAIEQLFIEFGSDTTGNDTGDTLQILGLAFINQTLPIRESLLVLGRTNTKIILAEPMANLDHQDPIDLNSPLSSNAFKNSPIQSEWGSSDAFSSEQTEDGDYSVFWSTLFYVLFLSALALLWHLIFKRNKKIFIPDSLSKTLNEIHWPFSITEPHIHKKVEKQFWSGMAENKEEVGWLSTTGLRLDKSSSNEYFGEAFLRRQITLAFKSNIYLLPSLALTNVFSPHNLRKRNHERSLTAIKTMAIETISRFSDIAIGVRIENTAELLSINTKPRNQTTPRSADTSDEYQRERVFWSDVIQTIREKNPGFIFIADAIGDKLKLARNAGFDYYENNFFTETLMDQIQKGKVGDAAAFLRGEAANHLPHSIFNISPIIQPILRPEIQTRQNIIAVLTLGFLPGIIQHDNNMPEELNKFIHKTSEKLLLRDGGFVLLIASDPSVLAFARWIKKSLLIIAINFSQESKKAIINLRPFGRGLESNKMYLFNNALHGTNTLKTLLNQPSTEGPALALWGQSLTEAGLPLSLPGLSLHLYSVNLSRSISDSFDLLPSTDISTSSMNR